MRNHSKNAWYSTFCWGKTVIIMTVFYNAIIVACAIRPFWDHMLWVEILMVFLFLLPMLFWPIRLKVSDDEIKIFRPVGPVKVPFADVKSVSFIEDGEQFFDKLIRTFGSGGVYGYWGWYKHEKHGKVRMFVTDMKHCFLVKLKNGKMFVVSSTKRQEIVKFIGENIEIR